MPALRVVSDRVVGSQADPVRDRPILPHLLRELLLDSESLVRRHFRVPAIDGELGSENAEIWIEGQRLKESHHA